ncbi:sensor histidine kinase [Stenotrophomonas maltophilia]|uniref:sensor histidine kinase n=1 Tax=Stenotrophomonas maltophilia TaxID=40324 RepID=UPI000746FA18|nr:HAMP domain-containing sensor histidine kinase [Stenotrophomonas maltophilia]KUJ03922.1 hypothetical protein AR275_31930 [Stenotrophomonas maltophilia]MBH1476815.1 HAMP domain-containing histidine kinase [Stenotrophomonas maltophilia]MBH1502332.1 HAMP domain-containing histidine kinase [Stenotrophomonas maltophilia]HEL7888369.1 HAMP domain-containing histidine kinase [Stenotrophomonas maltophilia]
MPTAVIGDAYPAQRAIAYVAEGAVGIGFSQGAQAAAVFQIQLQCADAEITIGPEVRGMGIRVRRVTWKETADVRGAEYHSQHRCRLGPVVTKRGTANFYQIAPLVHVLVMSYGLALRLRQLQYDKAAAEQKVTVATRRSEEQRQLVAMLSHEFGNPLAAIDRAAQMIQIKTPGLASSEVQRLAQIRSNAAALSGFVDHFLMTEAPDHGALAVSPVSWSIRGLPEDAVQRQGEVASGHLRLGECSDGDFSLDPTLVGVAVGNLLANALRYSPPQSKVELAATLDDAGLCIRVAYQGPGMSQGELDRLGTPYFRGTASLGKKGDGLGYHFTRRIVEAHGGRLTARSSIGSGLEVEIFLPDRP